jgi:hypothetical protein
LCEWTQIGDDVIGQDIFHKKGLDEALKFAWNDEAETARKEAALMAENSCSSSCGYWRQRSIDSGASCGSRCHGPP